MKTLKNNLDAIKEHLTDLSNDELVNIWNTYAREHASDDEIYNNDDEFFNTFFESKTPEAVRAVCFGEYRYQDEYVQFNGYANLESFNDASDNIDIDLLAAEILENPQDYDIELEEEESEEDIKSEL